MSDAFASVGTSLSVCATLPATQDAAGFAALTWILVGEVAEIPSYGREQAEVTHTPLATGIVEKRGGSVNMGDQSLTAAYSEGDLGAAAIETKVNGAVTADKRMSFMITLPSGEKHYYIGNARSFRYNPSGADSIFMCEFAVGVTSTVVKVAAP